MIFKKENQSQSGHNDLPLSVSDSLKETFIESVTMLSPEGRISTVSGEGPDLEQPEWEELMEIVGSAKEAQKPAVVPFLRKRIAGLLYVNPLVCDQRNEIYAIGTYVKYLVRDVRGNSFF